jgi:hypothetical protein
MFYTYLWLREDGTPYYVGKGKNKRGLELHYRRNKKWLSPPPLERIVIYPAESETEAFETEIDLIWYYGRKDLGTGCLRNLTDGGENPPNWKGKKRPEQSKRMLGNTVTLGLKLSKETCSKMSKTHLEKFSSTMGPALRVERAQAARLAMHFRWHVNRDIVKEGCVHCVS